MQRQSDQLLAAAGLEVRLPDDLTDVLVAAFAELRAGRLVSGEPVDQLSTAMSTAEAVSVAVSTGLAAAWFGDGAPNGTHLVEAMIGTALKDNTEDLSRLRGYFARGVKGRAGRWREVYAAQDRILQ